MLAGTTAAVVARTAGGAVAGAVAGMAAAQVHTTLPWNDSCRLAPPRPALAPFPATLTMSITLSTLLLLQLLLWPSHPSSPCQGLALRPWPCSPPPPLPGLLGRRGSGHRLIGRVPAPPAGFSASSLCDIPVGDGLNREPGQGRVWKGGAAFSIVLHRRVPDDLAIHVSSTLCDFLTTGQRVGSLICPHGY